MLNTLSEGTSPTGAMWVVVTDGTDFFMVSTVKAAFDTGLPETLVFRCDANGDVTSWIEVAGGVGKSRTDAIVDLKARLVTNSLNEHVQEDYLDAVGGPFGMISSLTDKIIRGTEPDPQDFDEDDPLLK